MTDSYGIGSDTMPGLAKTVEEVGELLQLLGKVLARGGNMDHRWVCVRCGGKETTDPEDRCEECKGRGFLGSGPLHDRMHEELGDTLAAIQFFIDLNEDIDAQRVDARREAKHATYHRWHQERTFAQ